MKVAPGDAVLTNFGSGVVVRCSSEPPSTTTTTTGGEEDGEEAAGATRGDRGADTADANGDGEGAGEGGEGGEGGAAAGCYATIRFWRRPGSSVASCAVVTARLRPSAADDDDAAAEGAGGDRRSGFDEGDWTPEDEGRLREACEACEGGGDGGRSGLRVLRRLAAAPGMIVRARVDDDGGGGFVGWGSDGGADGDEGGGPGEDAVRLLVIERYLPAEDVYVASALEDGGSAFGDEKKEDREEQAESSEPPAAADPSEKRLYRLSPSQIASTSAKFYPILQDLIEKGDAAWDAAMESCPSEREVEEGVAGVAGRLSSAVTVSSPDGAGADADDVVAGMVSRASKSSAGAINARIAEAGAASAPASSLAEAAKERLESPLSLPRAEEVRQVYDMLRDDDLTDLFARGKERLRELVDVEVPVRTREALGRLGIEIDGDGDAGGDGSIRGRMDRLRRDALASLDELLKAHVARDDDGNIILRTGGGGEDGGGGGASVQISTRDILDGLPSSPSAQRAREQFAQVFDRLSRVSTSDPQLQSIFGTISEKTRLWQEMTGRILQTRTASLFAEGGQRLRVRAAEVLGDVGSRTNTMLQQGQQGGSGGSADLTRALTEGDVAKARLKSVEMGDAIRKRLFAAIEVRSESSGGLDAIIAGSLQRAQSAGDGAASRAASLLGAAGPLSVPSDGASEDEVQRVVASLRASATSSMAGAKETLVALLSERSGYREQALLRLERVFLDLESQLGGDLTPEQMAALASGEGGSLALFEPIAARAAREIEAQLDAAEARMRGSENWTPAADDVVGKVRQIARGELGMADVLEMAAGYLDDDEVVARSGGLIVKAESLLDDFEAATARHLGDEKALAKGRGKAGAGIMDAVAKAGISKDEIMKGVEGLDVNRLLDGTQSAMTDEAARRELISNAGDTALDFLLKILPSMPVPPFDGVRDGLVYHLSNLSMAGFKVKKEDIYIEIAGMRAARVDGDVPQSEPSRRTVKASELLVIDIRNISATLDDAVWSFEQTYMPYLKGSGKANTKLWDGAIRLKFELRRRLKEMSVDRATGRKATAWEPVLCLNDRNCSIGGVELVVQGESRITWVANKLASLLGTRLRDYVVGVIINALKNNSGWLIDHLNTNLSNYWDFIMRTANLKLEELPMLARHHVTKAEPDEAADEVELVWRERVPLGLNILTNDESGYLKVIDLPRGTQARKIAQDKDLDPDLFKGSTIVSVNGKRYGPDSQVDLFAALKDPARPKAILFKLASQTDLEKLEKMVKCDQKPPAASSGENNEESADLVTVVDIVQDGDIGLKFASHGNFALAVSDFLRDSSGSPRAVESSGKVAVGDLLSHINGTLVLGEKGEGKEKALSLFEEVGSHRPLSLGFVKPYLHNVVLQKDEAENDSCGGPSELVFTNKIVLKDFAPAEGAAETGGVFVGDNLVFVNGSPVGAGCRLLKSDDPVPTLDEVMKMLKQYSPLALTFGRAQAKQASTVKTYLTSSPLSFNVESCSTFSIAASDYSHLGCSFAKGMNGSDIVVKGINGVDGPFKRQMAATKKSFIGCKLESVDGEVVPTYSNPQLIVNAMKRRWTANGKVELTFSNDAHRDALQQLGS